MNENVNKNDTNTKNTQVNTMPPNIQELPQGVRTYESKVRATNKARKLLSDAPELNALVVPCMVPDLEGKEQLRWTPIFHGVTKEAVKMHKARSGMNRFMIF